MREVLFRSYVADMLSSLAGEQTRWAEIAYGNKQDPQQAEQPDPRSTEEIAESIIDGLGAILERGDTE